MAYNHIYNLQFKGLDQVGTDFYYQVKFEKYEATSIVYDVIELIPAQSSPFVLRYKSTKDNIFAPIRSSFADIKCFIPYNSTVQPYDFYYETDEFTLRVSLYETDGTTSTLKWRGFLLPDVIQYEWQEQYYLQITASDNLAILKDIKYTREDYYALYNDTNVATGINISDFICRLLKKTGSELDVAIFSQFKIDDVLYNISNLKLSEYSSVDWSNFEPKDCYKLLTSLMESLGCMLYQSNKDATWYIISINDAAVNELIIDGSFSIDGTIIGQPYEYWTISGYVINSSTGGLNGSQCPKIFGDNTSYVLQSLSFNAAEYLIGFWAKNDGAVIPRAVVRVEIDGMEVFNQVSSDEWTYYEFIYTSGGAGLFNIVFFNDNPDDNGYLLIDNVSVKQQYQNGLKYDIDGTYLSTYTFDFYSTIGNDKNVIWSDVNQLVSLNKRLTNVQFKYPYYERNLLNNYGFFKNYATLTSDPTNWVSWNSFDFFNATGENRPFDNRIVAVRQNYFKSSPHNYDTGLYSVFRLSNDSEFYPYFAVKIECDTFFDGAHNDGDSTMVAFAKSHEGIPNTPLYLTRYLQSNGTYNDWPVDPRWRGEEFINIPMSQKDRWQKFKCYSKFDKNSMDDGEVVFNYGTFIIRHQLSAVESTVHTTYIDNIKVSIIPQQYQNTKKFIYNATNVPNDSTLTKPFTNNYKVENGQYHGGIADKWECQVIEDFIGYLNDEQGTIFNSDKWLRNWEAYNPEANPGRPLQETIGRSILSFYQATWQKFTGNVYGKNINFGQIFTISLAQGLHFMHEASFDYVSNKTNITTHQSQSNKLETGFRTWSTTEDDMGAGQGSPGSTTSNIQEGGE
jgi:hypothetical protein